MEDPQAGVGVWGPPAWGRVDYLRVTVWRPDAPIGRVEQRDGTLGASESDWSAVVREVVDECLSDQPQWWAQWTPRGARRGGVMGVYEALAGISVLDYGELFAQVEITGQGCELLGNEGVARMLVDIARTGCRWRCSRIDFAWDGIPASVSEIREALRARRVRTRAKMPTEPPYHVSEDGNRTVYTGPRDRDQLIRFYDRRGPVRCEYEAKGEVAAALGEQLLAVSCDDWPALAMAAMRGYLDFADRRSATNTRDWDLLPWWQEFVADAERGRLARPTRDERAMTAIQRLEYHLATHHRILAAAIDAYGEAWLAERVRHHVRHKGTAGEISVLRDELDRARGSKIGGAPDVEVEIPI